MREIAAGAVRHALLISQTGELNRAQTTEYFGQRE